MNRQSKFRVCNGVILFDAPVGPCGVIEGDPLGFDPRVVAMGQAYDGRRLIEVFLLQLVLFDHFLSLREGSGFEFQRAGPRSGVVTFRNSFSLQQFRASAVAQITIHLTRNRSFLILLASDFLYFIVERRFDVLKQAFKLNAFDGTGFVFLS